MSSTAGEEASMRMMKNLQQQEEEGGDDEVFRQRKWALEDAVNMSVIGLEHLALLFAPSYFTWDAFCVTVMLVIVTGLFGLGLSYHRNLTHRSFKLQKGLEYFFAYCGLHGGQGHPIIWVSSHRYHHQFVDTQRDPHSPIEGFWFSHVTWLFDYNYLRKKVGKANNAMDLQMQAYYRFLESTYHLHILGLGLLLYVVGGLPYLIWGMGVRLVYMHHMTFLINSACHTWGQKPWNTKDLSRNNWLLGLLVFGEGWHNNHHAFEFSARFGLEWWQIDLPWYVVKLLEYVGLATDVKEPSELQKRKMSFSHKEQ